MQECRSFRYWEESRVSFQISLVTTSLDCAKTADVTFFKGNDLRPATGIILSSSGKRMVTILDLDDFSSHRRHIDQVEFNVRGDTISDPALTNKRITVCHAVMDEHEFIYNEGIPDMVIGRTIKEIACPARLQNTGELKGLTVEWREMVIFLLCCEESLTLPPQHCKGFFQKSTNNQGYMRFLKCLSNPSVIMKTLQTVGITLLAKYATPHCSPQNIDAPRRRSEISRFDRTARKLETRDVFDRQTGDPTTIVKPVQFKVRNTIPIEFNESIEMSQVSSCYQQNTSCPEGRLIHTTRDKTVNAVQSAIQEIETRWIFGSCELRFTKCGEIVQEHMDLALKSFGDLIQPRPHCTFTVLWWLVKQRTEICKLDASMAETALAISLHSFECCNGIMRSSTHEFGLVCKLCQKTLRVVKSVITSESFLNLIRDQFYLVCDPKLLVHDLCTQLMESFLEDIVIHINSIEPMKMCQFSRFSTYVDLYILLDKSHRHRFRVGKLPNR
ncbi:hypothetical protein CLF_102137 [Clonorchis sinensis]|uniref:Saposin B-type domain-containing protein n=1 Tax=Clonorchis sinensis TaxID=79923 RepID=G7YMY3_CLOSI|nr:hypothetical protein CLF_102137 [Clonorchis sinensis]